MGRITITSSGSGAVLTMLDKVAQAPEIAVQALQAGADVLLPEMKEAAPVRTGEHIRDRLESRKKGGTKNPSVLVGVWGEPVAYYVEYGHGGPHPAPPHPYMKPTAEATEDDVVDAIMDVLERELG